MKKAFARFLTAALVLSVLACCFGGMMVSADGADGYKLFIAYGGDKNTEGDWGWGYTGEDASGITAVAETIKPGETKTVSLTFETPTVNSWYFAPCLTGTGIGDTTTKIDFTISCKIDGTDVPINMEADGKTWWPEDTGSLSGSDCIRLAGGYNEWATKYIDEPGSFTTIEYTITLNSTDPSYPTNSGLDNQPKTAENPAIAVFAGLGVLAVFGAAALVLNRKQII